MLALLEAEAGRLFLQQTRSGTVTTGRSSSKARQMTHYPKPSLTSAGNPSNPEGFKKKHARDWHPADLEVSTDNFASLSVSLDFSTSPGIEDGNPPRRLLAHRRTQKTVKLFQVLKAEAVLSCYPTS